MGQGRKQPGTRRLWPPHGPCPRMRHLCLRDGLLEARAYALRDAPNASIAANHSLSMVHEQFPLFSRTWTTRRMAIVAAPSYLAGHPMPLEPEDLTAHRCIRTRMPTHGDILIWDLERGAETRRVRVEGPLIVSALLLRINAALEGVGLAFVPEDQVAGHIAAGRLVPVLPNGGRPMRAITSTIPRAASRPRRSACCSTCSAIAGRPAIEGSGLTGSGRIRASERPRRPRRPAPRPGGAGRELR